MSVPGYLFWAMVVPTLAYVIKKAGDFVLKDFE